MKTLIPFILLICGLGLAAFVWYGNKRASEKSDEERVLEAVLEQQEQARAAQARAESLMSDILAAPAACDGLTTGTVFRLCEMEPDVGEDWPDLMATTSPKERTCLLDSFHQTNRHAFEIRSETYDGVDPDTNRMGRFVSDLCTAALWTDGIDYGDTDKPLSDLIAGFYADRATSRVKPAQSY
ncbi:MULTISPECIES: hypothetical protein [Hyphomonas]|uniref:Uncharacterized protein n=1 Tax=Hyphomonas adhaerens TaxID=81029 RepID=A0A3B9H2Y8_9PROT|nr:MULTISPECIES: hypothetical protein [Hyphomonas]MBB39794.1 hypothetical protein [Hyphomonas sp.]HAE29059.1 hypothetical protein [Hyphomonas adhaerens]